MPDAQHRSFTRADEIREFPKGKAEIVSFGGNEVGRYTFLPGWRWSTDVEPLVKTASCRAPHFQTGTRRSDQKEGRYDPQDD